MQGNSAAGMGSCSPYQEGGITVQQLSAALDSVRGASEEEALDVQMSAGVMAAVARHRIAATERNVELMRVSVGQLQERLRRVAAVADSLPRDPPATT